MPAPLLETVQMLLWEGSEDWRNWGPEKHHRCTICGGRLHTLVVVWRDNRRVFFCADCCASICRGFSADLRRVVTFKAVQRLGFHGGARAAATGNGVLVETTTGKQ
jgi:hypothetical protein